ncbi:HD-GYP domain-containing protein [Oscillospiraceae bacterium LTW-04]|nr:HD-GYP domain-containing protein [Oscillospiraceae bacterium MB24-C1]
MKDNQNQSSLMLFHELLAAIVAAMEARDSYTASHSSRVADITEFLCRLLQLPVRQSETIHIAAHVHDIGKIGVPDVILHKSGRLTDNEWFIMRQHPTIGFNILSKISGFEDIALCVRHHHERWDGSGYPAGLSGEAIPLGARIISLADSVDAMMSERKYRERLLAEDCRNEIARCRGSMYDPGIVDLMLLHWAEIKCLLNHEN